MSPGSGPAEWGSKPARLPAVNGESSAREKFREIRWYHGGAASSYEDGAVVDLGWMDGERTFFLETAGDGAGYYKFYSPKQGTSYDNWDNERAQQVKVRRRWLAWLRDRVWEDE